MSIPDRGPIAPFDFYITPEMIKTRGHFFDAFDHSETEVSANWIVQFMKLHGGWAPFSREDLEKFYNTTRKFKKHQAESFHFNRLIEPGRAFYIRRGWVDEGGGWVVVGNDGLLHVTQDFVRRCYKSSPQ